MSDATLQKRLRDSLWALRTRGDASVIEAVTRGSLDWRRPAGSHREHLDAAMAWLCAAQDAAEGGGVAALYDVRSGAWGPPYPETTGYIIETFFDYASYTLGDAYRARARRMADWLLTLQLADGGFPIGPLWPDWPRVPIVFDTGQIVHGLVRSFRETGDVRYLDAAARAGAWLVQVQDADGCWRTNDALGHAHTYNARTAWALLRLAAERRDDALRSAAIRYLTWAVRQQYPDGWFRNAAFKPDEAPLTHTIAYTLEGILESGVLLSDQAMIDTVRLAADHLMVRQEQDAFLRGRYGAGWQPGGRSLPGPGPQPAPGGVGQGGQVALRKWSCLTGAAQMAVVWLRLRALTGEEKYRQAGEAAIGFVKQTQVRGLRRPGVTGGIAGSYPIYGEYEPYRCLNWATKFFADSLLRAVEGEQGSGGAEEQRGSPPLAGWARGGAGGR